MRMVCRLDAQKRFTVVPGTVSGRPASRAARRPRFIPCRSCGKPQPTITSTTSSRGSSGTCFSAASIANATRSSGRASTSDPFRARPIGVRVAATMTASGKRALSRQRAADDQLLHLARPFVQRRDPGIPQVTPDGVLVDVTVAAVDLHGGVRSANGRLAREVLRDRRLQRVPRPRVGERCRPPREQARSLSLDRDLRDQLLDELERGDRPAELLPLARIRNARLEAALADPDAPGRQRDPTVVERRHRDLEALALRAEPRRVRHADAFEKELARVLRAQAELALDRPRLEPRRIRRNEEAREPARALASAAREDQRNPRPRPERDEDLLPADQPVGTVALGAGDEARGIGPRSRLRQRVAAERLARPELRNLLVAVLVGSTALDRLPD